MIKTDYKFDQEFIEFPKPIEVLTYNVGSKMVHEVTYQVTNNTPSLSFLIKSKELRLSFVDDSSYLNRCETYDIELIKINRLINENNDNYILNVKIDVKSETST